MARRLSELNNDRSLDHVLPSLREDKFWFQAIAYPLRVRGTQTRRYCVSSHQRTGVAAAYVMSTFRDALETIYTNLWPWVTPSLKAMHIDSGERDDNPIMVSLPQLFIFHISEAHGSSCNSIPGRVEVPTGSLGGSISKKRRLD